MNLCAPLICLAAALALGACSTDSLSPRTPPPPGSAINSTAATQPARSSVGTAAEETVPLFSVPGSTPPASERREESSTSERRQADTEACYRFAWAQVDNDIRIDDDIASARGEANSQFARNTDLTRRVDSYYYEKQRISRFEGCMHSKGYDPE